MFTYNSMTGTNSSAKTIENENEMFPDEWKVARVIPLYKSGQRNIPGNYRPISVLPAISKIME